MVTALDLIGFRNGLTYQIIPYNFFQSISNNELNYLFSSNLKRIYEITGKKVVILGHSLGNLNILHQLNLLDQSVKDSQIKNWVAIAPPLFGAMESTKILLGGDDAHHYLHYFGLKFSASAYSLGSSACIYELALKNMYKMFEGQQWFDWVEKRLQYENGEIPHSQSGMLFWPSLKQSCSPDTFTFFDKRCFSGLEDMRKRPSVIVDKKKYYLDNNHKLMSDWPLLDYSADYMKTFKNEEFNQMTNPGVQTFVLFLRTFKTINQIEYPEPITKYTKNNEFPLYSTNYSYGDGRVPTNSYLIPFIKWAYEFENQTESSAKVII